MRVSEILADLQYKRVDNTVREGGFGKIRRFHDIIIGSDVAMKTILLETKGYGLPSSVLREISVLKELEHENVVRLHDVIYTPEEFNLSFEWLDSNLSEVIGEGPIDPLQIKSFLSQILKGVCYCHSHKVLHRDLKPDNLLVDHVTKKLKLADFGLTRTFDVAPSEYSVNVGTPAYKAPELMLNMRQSTPAVDMWSVGCIFAEMVTGKLIFGGNIEFSVMKTIIRMLGVPSEEEWPGITAACTNIAVMDTLSSDPLSELAKVVPNLEASGIDLLSVVPNLEASGIDLLSRMLRLTPGRRISAHDALEHPYLRNFR